MVSGDVLLRGSGSFGLVDWLRSGTGFLVIGFLGIMCAATWAIEVGTVWKVCLQDPSLDAYSSSSRTGSGTLGGTEGAARASELASTLPTLNMVLSVSKLARGLKFSRLFVRGNKPEFSCGLCSTSRGAAGTPGFSSTCVRWTVAGPGAAGRRALLRNLWSLLGL